MIILRTSCCAGWRLDDCDRENCPLLQDPQSLHFSGTIITQYYSRLKLKVLTCHLSSMEIIDIPFLTYQNIWSKSHYIYSFALINYLCYFVGYLFCLKLIGQWVDEVDFRIWWWDDWTYNYQSYFSRMSKPQMTGFQICTQIFWSQQVIKKII